MVAHLDLVARRQEGLEPQDESLSIPHAVSNVHPALGRCCTPRPLPTPRPRTPSGFLLARGTCMWCVRVQTDLVAGEEFGHMLNRLLRVNGVRLEVFQNVQKPGEDLRAVAELHLDEVEVLARVGLLELLFQLLPVVGARNGCVHHVTLTHRRPRICRCFDALGHLQGRAALAGEEEVRLGAGETLVLQLLGEPFVLLCASRLRAVRVGAAVEAVGRWARRAVELQAIAISVRMQMYAYIPCGCGCVGGWMGGWVGVGVERERQSARVRRERESARARGETRINPSKR